VYEGAEKLSALYVAWLKEEGVAYDCEYAAGWFFEA
jgi:hypothetical protein